MFAGAAFFFAFFGLVGLFALKRWEGLHDRILFPEIRRKVDEGALRIKSFMLAVLQNFGTLPYILLYSLRISVHVSAIGFGHLAHWIGERSHSLADLVSHKHRFERREPRSEFLKKVIEHPITNRVPERSNVPGVPVEGIHLTLPITIAPSVSPIIEQSFPSQSPLVPVTPVKKKRTRKITKKTVKDPQVFGEEGGLDR